MKPEKAARKRRPPWRRILLLPAVLLLAVAAYFIESRSGWSDLYRAAGVSLDAPDADLLAQTSTTVTVLDVGQGDAVLIGQDGAYCLIDTGPSDAKGDLVRDLQLAGISKLDYLVLTHPHADHTGGAREVLRNFAVGQLLVPPWDAQASGETADWPRGLFDLAAEQGTDVITAEDGTVYPLGSGTLTVFCRAASPNCTTPTIPPLMSTTPRCARCLKRVIFVISPLVMPKAPPSSVL